MAQDLEQLQERRAKLMEQVAEIDSKMEDLKKARRDELLAELRELGFDSGRKTKASTSTRQRDPEKPCPICDVKGHDARAHRSQGKNKKPFTKEELKERGLPVS